MPFTIGLVFPPAGGNIIKKPAPKKKKAAPKAPAGKAKSGGKDIVVFGLNVSSLVAKLKSRKGKSAPVEDEEEFDEPTEVFVEIMESDEPPPPSGPRSRVRYGDDAEPPFPRAGKRHRPAAKRRAGEDEDFADESDETDGEEETPKKRGPFGLFSLFGGKKKAKHSKSSKQEKAGKKKPKPAPPPEEDDEEYDYEDEEEINDFDPDEEEEEEEISPRSRKGKKGKAGKNAKSARGGKKKKGTSPVLMLLLVLILLAGLAYAAHTNGLVDLSMYINNITDSLSMLLSMAGL